MAKDPKAPLAHPTAMLLTSCTRTAPCSPLSVQCLAQSTGRLRVRHARNARPGSRRWTSSQPQILTWQKPASQTKNMQRETRRHPPALLPLTRPSTHPSSASSLGRTWQKDWGSPQAHACFNRGRPHPGSPMKRSAHALKLHRGMLGAQLEIPARTCSANAQDAAQSQRQERCAATLCALSAGTTRRADAQHAETMKCRTGTTSDGP